jgi:hypothetical protein
MSSATPPNPYFSGINFNPGFFSNINDYLTEAIANLKYLKLVGGVLTGFLGIKRTPRVELDVNGKAVIKGTAIPTNPAQGEFGSDGTKLILVEGTVSETPIAIGSSSDGLWIGTNSITGISFYTGLSHRMRLKNNGYVGIGTTDPKSLLTVNSYPAITNAFDFSVTPTTITNLTPTSTTVLNDPLPTLFLCREGTVSQAYASRATFSLCRWENNANNSRTRLDIGVSHAQFDNVNIMSLRSDGNVGIGTTNPGTYKLFVSGNIRTSSMVFYNETNTAYELLVTGPSPTAPANIQTIQQGVGFNQNLTLQAAGGNVGIGTSDPLTNKLFVNGDTRIDGSLYVNATYSYFGASDITGLRIGKNDIFTSGGNAGGITIFTQNTGQNIILGYFGGNGNILTVANTSVTISQQLTLTSQHLQLSSTNGNNIGVATTPNQFSTSAATGDMVIRSIQKLLLQSGSGNSAITIGTNNYLGLGIGSTTANFPITLYSTSSTAQSMTSYAIAGISIYNGNQSTPINPAITVGIMSQAAFNSGFYVYSDQRIKKDITPLENSLDIIDKINTVSFKYIDFIEKGTIKNYGVIAQEIEKIIPEVINSHKDYIPNIYKNADKYDNELLRLYIKTDDLSIGDDIKIYDMKNKHHLKKIVDKTDEYITINEPIEDYEKDTSVFVYGKEIEDVKNVNYESLFIMNIKATQELHQRLKTLEDIIKNLINR